MEKSESPLCGCGCKGHVTWNKKTKYWNIFIHSHNSKTPEARLLMSSLKRDVKQSLSQIQKRATKNKGKKRTFETRQKMSDAKKGRMLSEDHRRQLSIAKLENSKKDKIYCDAFYDEEYKDSCRKSGCEMCGISKNMHHKLFGSKLILHHDEGNLNCAPNEMMTLCRSCHPKRHKFLKEN